MHLCEKLGAVNHKKITIVGIPSVNFHVWVKSEVLNARIYVCVLFSVTVWRVCQRACVCVPACVSFERMPGRKRQRVCGILLSWHKCDMRSPRALVIMRECIVAVFKTAAVDGIHSGRALNAGLRKLT